MTTADAFMQALSEEKTGTAEQFNMAMMQEQDQFYDLKEIGSAPELNEFTMPAFKASAGLLFVGNEKGAKGVIEEQFPDANVRQGEGGLVVDLPSGSYRLRGPAQIGTGLATQIGTFIAAGRLMPGSGSLTSRMITGGITSGGVQTGIEAAEQGLGGERISATDVAIAAGTGSIAEAIPALWGLGKQALQDRALRKAILQAAPENEAIKSSAREIYKQIDDMGVSIKPDKMQGIASGLRETMRNSGFNRRIHPKVSAALDEFDEAAQGVNSLSQVDILRRIGNAAKNSLEPDEARLGSILVSSIDDSLDALKQSDLVSGSTRGVSNLYKQSRDLWRRARKNEIIQESLVKAKNQASGFENGMRVQMRSILNNKKLRRQFTPDEIASIERVVQGTTPANMAKMLGKFGISENQASNMLMATMGGGAGATVGSAVGGPGGAFVGAVVVPGVGQVSKKLAQKLTENNAKFVDAYVRAGPDAKRIASAYLRFVPKADRNPADLASLFLNNKNAMEQVRILAQSPSRLPSELNNRLIKDTLFFIKGASPVAIREAAGIEERQ